MKHFFAILTTLISLHAQATELFNGSTPKPFQMAQPLAKGSTIGGYPIWDGEEKWKIVHASTYNSSGPGNAIKIGKLGLLQTEDKTFVAYMEVSGNVSAGSNRDWSNEPCKYENLLFKANLGRAFDNINCVTITHATGYYSNPTGMYSKIYALMKDQGIDIPPTVIKINFTRYAAGGRWMSVSLAINPELLGFARDNETWGRSGWHQSQAFNDPAKKQFLDTLSKWALSFAKQMDVAFDKKPGAFDTIPSWRSSPQGPVAQTTKSGPAVLN